MPSSKTREIQGRNIFAGALRMQLGPDTEAKPGSSGSPPASTLPSAAIPMAHSPAAGRQPGSDSSTPAQNRRLAQIDSASSSRRGSFDGSSVVRKTRQRKADSAIEHAGESEHVSNQQENRSTSLSQKFTARSQALLDVLHGVFGSQSTADIQDKEVRYPKIIPQNVNQVPMPGAFPESPQKGSAAIELPQATVIGSEMSMVRPPPGRGSPLARSPRGSPLDSLSPTRKFHGIEMDDRLASPKLTTLIDRPNRNNAKGGRAAASTSTSAVNPTLGNDLIPTGSNEQTPIAQPRSVFSTDFHSPAPRRTTISEPMSSNTDLETDVPTRPVTPEAQHPIHGLLPTSHPRSPLNNIPPAPFMFNPRGIDSTLMERFPVMVAHSPKHQALWDRLSVGSLFTVARLACELGIDLETLDSRDLQELVGKNITMVRVEEVLRRARGEDWINLEKPDRRIDKGIEDVAKELDWEAEQIVGGTGEMLGWKEERGTRYGGKVQFSAALRLDEKLAESMESATEPLNLTRCARVTLEPPRLRGSSIFGRTHGSHHFLRIRAAKKIEDELSPWTRSGKSRERARNVLREWAARPIFILGRVYAPLVEKDGVFIYFLEGIERVGAAFDKGSLGYGITACTTVHQFIDWWSPLHHNRKENFQKLATRLELGFSDTLPGMLIMPKDIKVADDIVNEHDQEFTDGAGLMTPSVTRALLKKYGDPSSHQLHMAYQVRIHTAKGVLLVDPIMMEERDFSGPHQLKLYRSMCKASRGGMEMGRGPVNGFSILDAACCILCVVKPAPSSSPAGARLSSQFVTILSHGGVPDDVFLRLQSEALRKELETWTKIETEDFPDGQVGRRIDENTRLRLAKAIAKSKGLHQMVKKKELGGMAKGLGYGRSRKADRADELDEDEDVEASSDEEHPDLMAVKSFESLASVGTVSGKVKRIADPWANNEISGLPTMKSHQLYLALLAGIDVPRSNFWKKIWLEIAKTAMFSFVSKFHITVGRSASGFFQPDPTGLLEEGEICFTVKEAMVDSETGIPVGTILGDVIVGRHPALLPTDMRKVKAVAIPLLQNHRGILFCSVKGTCSLASICAGGDHDGDEAMIIWEKAIVSPFHNADLCNMFPPEDFHQRFDKTVVEAGYVDEALKNLREPERSIRLATYLMTSVGEGSSFKIYNSFWNMAVYRDGFDGSSSSRGKAISTAAMMGHTFNWLMDSKKRGIQIKSSVLADDKEDWSLYAEPYWRQRQLSGEKAPTGSKKNLKELKPRHNNNILDKLVKAGEADMDIAIQELETQLRPTNPVTGSLYFNGNGRDLDLAAPWLEVEERSKANVQVEAASKLLKQSIQQFQARFRLLNVESAKKMTTSAQRNSKLLELCKDFAYLRVEGDTALCNPMGEHGWKLIKASCAYVCDSGRRGGEDNGFAWHVAMRDLCLIKATAMGYGNTFTLPFSTMEKMDVNKNWG